MHSILLACLCACSAVFPETETEATSLEFKVARAGDLLFLPVTLEGEPYSFVVNTSSTHTAYDARLRALLGDAIGTDVLNGTETVEMFRAPNASIGTMPLRSAPVPCVDFEFVRQLTGCEVHGMIGMDALANQIIRVDFDRGMLMFVDSAGDDAGEPIPLFIDERGKPYVHGLLPAAGDARFYIETCNTGSVSLTADDFVALRAAGQIESTTRTTVGKLQEVRDTRDGVLSELSIGPFRHKTLLASVAGDKNAIGLDYLSRFVVTFDFRNSVLYLKKGRNFDRPDRRGAGLTMLKRDGGWDITEVDPGSPAERAGMRAGDVLRKVGGTNAAQLTGFQIRQLLCREGRKVSVVVKRGEGVHALRLHLDSAATDARKD